MNQDTKIFLELLAAKGINVPLLIINTALLGRILGPEGFGKWSMIVAAATLMHTVLINWTHALTIRFGCEEWARVKSLHQTWSARLPLLLGCLITVAFLLIAQPADWLLRLFSVKEELWILILTYFIGIWLTEEARSILQATSQLTRQAVLNIAATCMTTLFLLFVVFDFISGALLWIIAGISTITIIIWGYVLVKTLGRVIICPNSFNRQEIMRHVTFGWPLIPSFIVGYISDWGDHIILQLYCSSSELGFFSVSYQFMLGVIAVNGTITTVLLPRLIMKNIHSDDTAKKYVVNIVPTLFCLFSIVLITITALLPVVFLFFMGESYTNSVSILLIFCVTIPTSILGFLYSPLFKLQQRLDRTFIYLLLITCINLGLSIMLIPSMGGTGAAIGTVVSYAVGQLSYFLDQHYHLKVSFDKVAIVFAIILIAGLLQLIAGPNLWPRVICNAASVIFLVFIFRRLQMVNPELLRNLFSGRLTPIGLFLNKVLVVNPANR